MWSRLGRLEGTRPGPMGRVDSELACRIRSELGGANLSIAMGELSDPFALEFEWPAIRGFQFAKIAAADCDTDAKWLARWGDWSDQVPPGVGKMAVAYADAVPANSLGPKSLLAATSGTRIDGLLIDTFEKNGHCLFDFIEPQAVMELSREAHRRGVLFAIAGSLSVLEIPKAMSCGPDFIAFRSAACVGGRSGRLSPARINLLRKELNSPNHKRSNWRSLA